jgi:hypothetical protein
MSALHIVSSFRDWSVWVVRSNPVRGTPRMVFFLYRDQLYPSP